MFGNARNAINTSGLTYSGSMDTRADPTSVIGGLIRDQAHPWQQLHAAECGEDLQHPKELFGAGPVGGWSSSPPLCGS